MAARILLLSTADTELLAARSATSPEHGVDYVTANPTRLEPGDLDGLLSGADIAVLRLLGGRKTWPEGVDALRTAGLPVVLLGGEPVPDAELMALSTVPAGVAAEALDYLSEGGVGNLRELARFLSDTVLLTGEGFAPPAPMPSFGVHEVAAAPTGTPVSEAAAIGEPVETVGPVSAGAVEIGEPERRPVIAIVFYRAHELSGNTAFIDRLCLEVRAQGAEPLPVFCGSLRGLGDGADGLLEILGRADAIITTVLAAGAAGTDEEGWDAGALASLDVPIVQALCLTTSRAVWEASDAAISPMDAAMQVAIPEFDGRLVSVPFSFKEEGPGGVPVYVADPERAARVAAIAVRYARLRLVPNAAKRVAVVLSSYPTKHSRVGNAVGLDTPASAVRLLRAMAEAGYDLGLDHSLWSEPGAATGGETGVEESGEESGETGGEEDGQTGGAEGTGAEPPGEGDRLIHALIAAGGHDVEWLTEEQLRAAPARVPLRSYERWFAALPQGLREGIRAHWGEPPGELYVDESADEPEIVLAALRFGNVILMIQPPRGFGENPVAIYHDPDLPPSHHYLAAYRWLDTGMEEGGFGADAVVHLGKHGTLEWLPGKGLGLSGGCAPDAVLGALPLVYPFIVNDPGEGTQAKRRGHATVVDHLVPPMARADTYGDLARLEQLLDEYATVQALDPAKLPAVRSQIWTLIQSAQLHHDLHVDDQPDDDAFDDFIMHVDGYLCEIKDVQIRDGLHILGQEPLAEARVNLVLAILRATQTWTGRRDAAPTPGEDPAGAVVPARRTLPGLRAAIAAAYGLDEKALLADPGAPAPTPRGGLGALVAAKGGSGGTRGIAHTADTAHAAATGGATDTGGAGDTGSAGDAGGSAADREVPRTASDLIDALEAKARELVMAMEAAGWAVAGGTGRAGVKERTPEANGVAGAVCADALGGQVPDVVRLLDFAATEVVPRLAATRDEIGAVLHALDGGHVPAGPSGSPTRGLVNVLPTGRNFYSVDPKAIPSRNAWDVGVALADSLIARHLADTGAYPSSVGLTVWGTSAMRTQGDDIAEVLALIGVRPVWDDASRRVTGFEVIDLAELGRPRIDVTLRISGFFRDAFPHVIALLDDAIETVARLPEEPADNFVRGHAVEDHAAHGDWRRATTRIFGSKPGAYGAGLLPLIDARNWRDDRDLAEVYAVWGGYAYGRGLDGRPARPDMEASFRRIAVAAKNQDTREHDIVDSDDYFQYHGGMVAMVRSLTGADPAAYVGDSALPDQVRTRTLAEETRRVFRARVVNPRWIAAMRRHGYKGAFELAATVDYLFGYDATAGVVDDWMYESLAAEYVFDPQTRAFMERANPWALRGITERLLEAADRSLWKQPDPQVLARLRETYLRLEGDLEGAGEDGGEAG